jgi:Resolvase, N terminal domain
MSGSKSSRNGLDRLMAVVRKGKVDIIVCYKLDRLGRSLAHLAGMIAEFTAHSVALVVPCQGIDTSGANSAARLQMNILCAVAEFEHVSALTPVLPARRRVESGLAGPGVSMRTLVVWRGSGLKDAPDAQLQKSLAFRVRTSSD